MFLTTDLYNSLKKWFSPLYNPNNLNSILFEYFKEARISNCMKRVFITSYDIHRNKPVFFTTRSAFQTPDKNAKIIDICRATSAAPTYFPSHRFRYDGENTICIDGGVFMNNPSLGVLIEILGNLNYKYYKVNEEITLNDISILSLGTGQSDKVLNSFKSSKWGQLSWIKPIIDLTTNGPVKVIHDQMETIFKMFGHPDNYLRINVDIEEKYSEMSDSRKICSDYLISETNSQILNNDTLKLKLDYFLENCGIK